MAGRPGPATLFGKWVVIPILVGLAGYFFVGPKIGKTPTKTTKTESNTEDSPRIDHSANGDTSLSTTPTTTERTSHERRKGGPPAPDLDISVRSDESGATKSAPPAADTPADTGPAKPTRRKRSKPAQKPPEEDANTPVVNQNGDSGQNDQGGSAGSTTAG